MTEQEKLEADQRRAGDFKLMGQTFLALSGVTLLFAVPMASYSVNGEAWFFAAGLSYTIFLASALSGGILGFIFSVPHANKITTEAEPTDRKVADGAASDKPVLVQHQPLLRSNSSLERISEWLTTMLVGVGLSQINSIFTGLKQFGEFLKPLDIVASSGTDAIIGKLQYVGPSALVAGLGFGFLSTYLFTRLRITHLFVDAERELNKRTGEDARLSVDEANALTTIVGEKTVISADAPSVRDALAVMTQLLYDVRNKGFLKAIEMGNELISTAAVSTARYWYLMAAAHGQRYTDRKAANAPIGELDAIKSEVLFAIDKALALNPKYKLSLRNMLNSDSTDNDLKSFADDEEFLQKLK